MKQTSDINSPGDVTENMLVLVCASLNSPKQNRCDEPVEFLRGSAL
jgi:hypothetical protein